MQNAEVDLTGSLSGRFSPEDWAKILARAAEQLAQSQKPQADAWADVIRDFHRQKYWGFNPDYIEPKPIKPHHHKDNLGKTFIWFSFRSFLLTKTVILYCGAHYTAGNPNPIYKWLFFGAFAFMLFSYGRFLWRYGNREES